MRWRWHHAPPATSHPPQGAAEKIKRENDVHLRQLAKKSTYVPSFLFYNFF
jgi:hypothetical protein